jgi:hypothetical protein
MQFIGELDVYNDKLKRKKINAAHKRYDAAIWLTFVTL